MPDVGLDPRTLLPNLILSLAVAGLAWVVYRVVWALIRARVEDRTQMHVLRVAVRNAIYGLAGVIILMVWLGSLSSFAIALGIVLASVVFASQEVIGSCAGYLIVISRGAYHVGDRVRIGSVTGDVIDLSIVRTVLLEVGTSVHADQYTGRIATVSNRAVFAGPVLNYTQRWQYMWDELRIPVTYASDWRQATEIMLEAAKKRTASLQDDARAGLQRMSERYPLHQAQVEPALYVTMTDNWVELTLRYVVDARQRRTVKAALHRELLRCFESEPNIRVASTTVEVVGLSPLSHAPEDDL